MRFTHGAIMVAIGIVGGIFVGAGTLLSQEAQPEEEKPLQVAQAPTAGFPEMGTIALDFKDADVQMVLQALARKAKINVVTSKGVEGLVTIHLENVSWEQALDTLSKTYGFGYEKDGNVILVSTLEELKIRREAMKELVEIEPMMTRVIELKFLDASDVQAFLEPQLTSQGRISILEMSSQKGLAFGIKYIEEIGGEVVSEKKEKRTREATRSKAIVITDTPTTIDRIEKILVKIDVMPKQVLIQTRAMEVSRDLLRDINLGAATGATAGNTSLSERTQPGSKQVGNTITEIAGAHILSGFTPSAFQPLTAGLTAAAAGTQLFFAKLTGTQFSALLQFLEEDVRTNTLSAPHVMTVSGQEAKIFVGTKYPIVESQQTTSSSGTQTTESLKKYANIGIQLYVVPQVSGERHINMLIHPYVSTRTGTVGTNLFPIMDVRETETQIVTEDGDTVVIGGLLKDIKSKSRIGVPFLGKLPLVGPFLSRTTIDTQKIDLLIFITATIVKPGALSSEEEEKLRQQYEGFLRAKLSKKGVSRSTPISEVEEVSAATPLASDKREPASRIP